MQIYIENYIAKKCIYKTIDCSLEHLSMLHELNAEEIFSLLLKRIIYEIKPMKYV